MNYFEKAFSTNPPTEPGFYWIDFSTIHDPVRIGSRVNPFVHYVEESKKHNGQAGDKLEVIINALGWLPLDELSGAGWLGPLPVPEMPKESE